MTMRTISFAMLLATAAAGAQTPAPTEWPVTLSPGTRAALALVADSARSAKVPTEPLMLKAAEGVLKGADDARIVAAVRALSRQLGEAKSILPAGSGTAVLTTAASALRAGVSHETLRALVESGRASDPADFAVALVTLADLAANGVTPRLAGEAVANLLQRGASSRDLAALRSAIAQDISAGIPPERALDSRIGRLLDDRDFAPRIARP